MTHITREQAIKIGTSGEWKNWSSEFLAYFQLHEDKLCVPFSVYHKALEEQLNRPVYTHEFAQPANLKAELEGTIPAPTMEQIIEQLEDLSGGKPIIILEKES
jgi:hypothetical protein